MKGQDMIDFQNSQGDNRYFDKNYKVVNINPNYKYLVGLDEIEKNSIVYKVDYIKNEGLLGGMLWAVDNDDFNHGNPIISSIYNHLYTAKTNARGVAKSYVIPSILGGLLVLVVVAVIAMIIVNRSKRPEIPITKKKKQLRRTISI